MFWQNLEEKDQRRKRKPCDVGWYEHDRLHRVRANFAIGQFGRVTRFVEVVNAAIGVAHFGEGGEWHQRKRAIVD